MLRDPMDRMQMVFIVVVAVAAVAIAVIGSSIVDRSYEHVKEIKQAKIEGTADDISMDIVKNADDANTILARTKGAPNELRFSDSTLTRAELKGFVTEPTLTKLKMLRVDFKSEDFDVLKDSKLKIISMSDVPVDKALIDAISAIPKLTTIEMFRCDISKNALMNLAASKIRLLKFRKCGETSRRIFTKAMAQDIARMPTLEYAELSKNTFEDQALQGLADAHCKVLNISKTNASDSDMETLKHLPRLQLLDVDDCARITCQGLKALAQSASIKQVRTNAATSSCEFSPANVSKFQASLYRLPDDMYFEKD